MLRLRHTLALLVLLFACDDEGDAQLEDASLGKGPRDAAVCRSQCDPYALECDEKPMSSFSDFDGTVRELSARCKDAGSHPFLVAGSCTGGGRVLYFGTGKGGTRRYFDSAGTFVSMETLTDYSRPPCGGRSYWPVPPACGQATVTDAICGQVFDVGDVLQLP